MDWAKPKLASGAKEADLTLFSTEELHIFQTYYGGLRPNAKGTEWIYGDFELVSQFIHEGQEMSKWLMDQSSIVALDKQNTLIGCLWQRTNAPLGGVVDGVTYERTAPPVGIHRRGLFAVARQEENALDMVYLPYYN